jgi:hypothetical protein
LYEDSTNLQLASFQGGVSLNTSVGRPYGELQSYTYEYLNGEKSSQRKWIMGAIFLLM